MDDAGVPPTGNETMKTIARAFVASALPRDEISIVRLHNYDDEPFGDRRLAESRIAAYAPTRRPLPTGAPQARRSIALPGLPGGWKATITAAR